MVSDALLLESLKSGDERAFATIVDGYSSSLLSVAMAYVSSRAVAEEVVQETWLAVIKGLDRFQGRSSLKTWIFSILTNTAKTRGQRERRSLPFSSTGSDDPAADSAAVDPDRFFPGRYPNDWSLGPTAWPTPEEGLVAGETRQLILAAIKQLPPAQRTVIALRDVGGWPPDEICDALDVSEGNQRVLLHRGRAKVRIALERYVDAVEETV